jgi:hypothetical protein
MGVHDRAENRIDCERVAGRATVEAQACLVRVSLVRLGRALAWTMDREVDSYA